MTSSECARALLLASIVLTTVATRARADVTDEARALFSRGRELASSGRCDEAIGKFRRALDLLPSGLGSLRNMALCEEQLGQFASARRDWWELRNRARDSRDSRYTGWDQDADEAFGKLGSKVAHVTIRVTGGNANATRVTINGESVDGRMSGEDVEPDPG